MQHSTLTSRGQTTIPAVIRRRLKLSSGDKLQFLIEGDRMIVFPARHSITELKGIVPRPTKTVTLEEMDDAIAEAASGIGNRAL